MVQEADGSGDAGSGEGIRPRPLIPVIVVRGVGPSRLVQWSVRGRMHRALVPADQVAGDACAAEDLAAGINMSTDWAGLWHDVNGDLSGKAVEAELQRCGIWTLEDATRDPARFYATLQRLAGLAGARMVRLGGHNG